MRSTLPFKFDGYCRYRLGTKYTQDDNPTDLVEICEGALRLVELYAEGHTATSEVCLSLDDLVEHLDRREDDSCII